MNSTITLIHVVGARPNFMKAAPLLRVLDQHPGFNNLLVHTGQHYDPILSDVVLRDLGVRAPDVNLGVGSGSHAQQTAAVMTGLEEVFRDADPALVVVVGDVNSTIAAALTAAKMDIPVAHVEAGLRSRDRSMPEEVNRVLTDQLADLLFTPSRDADHNLRREGIEAGRIHFVGNIMIDALLGALPRAERLEAWKTYELGREGYGLVTLHRPSNVDHRDQLEEIFLALDEVARDLPLLFPMHPRTRSRADDFGLSFKHVKVVEPVGYLEMLSLQSAASVVLTDSGGLQEETTVLGVPCLTLRSSTERPVTITEGTNRLVPIRSREAIVDAVKETLQDEGEFSVPEKWDGQTAQRIAQVIRAWWTPNPTLTLSTSPRMIVEGGEEPHA